MYTHYSRDEDESIPDEYKKIAKKFGVHYQNKEGNLYFLMNTMYLEVYAL